MEGKPYAEIAQEMGINTAYPSQAVYSVLKREGSQAELRQIAEKTEYTVDKCLGELDEAGEMARKRKIPAVLTQVAMSKAKVAGLLVERSEVSIVDRGGLQDRAGSTLSKLAVSASGITDTVQPNVSTGQEQAMPVSDQGKG